MKTPKLYLLGCILLCLSPAVALADGLTLERAVRTALAQHPELLSARQQIQAATGRSVQARLWPNPELELSAQDVPINGGGLSQSKNMIGLAQTVPFPGKKLLDVRIGRKGITIAESETLGRELELVRDVKMAFYRALAAERKVDAAEGLLTLNHSLADAARKHVAAGDATEQEQLRAEIESERASVEVTTAQRDLVEARKTLATLLGRPREPLGLLEGTLRETVELPVLANLPAAHPKLRAALANRERADLEWRRARLEPLPDVTLGVAAGRDEAANERLMEFRVTLPLPLFDRTQGRQRETRALAEIAKLELTSTEQKLVEQLDNTVARLRAARDQVDAYRTRILPKAEEALRLVRAGFDAGKFAFLDMADTQRTVAESRLAYYDKLLELNVTAAELEALLASDLSSASPETNEKSQEGTKP